MNIEPFGKTLIGLGIFLVVIGALITVGGKFGIGKLPGDIYINKGNFSFYFPITTSIIISIVLSIIFILLKR